MMEFYCFHCDEIIPQSEMLGDKHRKCLHWPHPMRLHPAYEKDAKAPLPKFNWPYPEDADCPDCGKRDCDTNH